MLSGKLKRALRAMDKRLAAFRPAKDVPSPPRGWIRAIREAVGMNGQQLAQRLGVAWQSMDDLERSEQSGGITLNSLRRVADALECQLVYALVPRSNESLSEIVNQRARAHAIKALGLAHQTMLLEDQVPPSGAPEQKVQDYIDEHVRDADLWKD